MTFLFQPVGHIQLPAGSKPGGVFWEHAHAATPSQGRTCKYQLTLSHYLLYIKVSKVKGGNFIPLSIKVVVFYLWTLNMFLYIRNVYCRLIVYFFFAHRWLSKFKIMMSLPLIFIIIYSAYITFTWYIM